ncbi:MAG TPA: hypothetical protein VGT40_02300 [Methylomirabilota bacterium]|jgi:hypothetical protein|nr:hypothetical protein [Methylomirabilota bacterium]
MSRRVFLLLVLGVTLSAAPAMAVISPSGIDPRLRLDWEPGQARNGRPVISGYLYNDYGRPANNVRLLVESLDGSGAVIDRALGFVVGPVPGLGRSYFIVPLKTPGASYRVSVTAFEWRDGGF